MGWASAYIARLRAGETVSFRPRGNSMQPRIESGQLVTVAPVVDGIGVEVGDVVLCYVAGAQYLHLVSAIDRQRTLSGPDKVRYRISNASGHVNGWCAPGAISGKVTEVAP